MRNDNGSYTLTITENGSYLIKFVHADGGKSQTTLNVDWINKTLEPVSLTVKDAGNRKRGTTVHLSFVEEVTILNDDIAVTRGEDGAYLLSFRENGTYTVRYRYADGTESSMEVVVDWLGHNAGGINTPVAIAICAGVIVLFIAGAVIAAVVVIKHKPKPKRK